MTELDAIEDAKDERSLWQAFTHAIASEGFDFYIYLLHLPGEPVTARTNLPADCYGKPEDDPFLRWCCSSHDVMLTGPAFAGDHGFLTGRAHDFIAKASRSGMVSGLGIPVILKRHGAHGGFNIGSRLPRAAFEEQLAPKTERIRSLCFVTHLKLRALLAASRRRSDQERRDRLTNRELEVFTLLAQGLSRQTIGTEIGISSHTVSTHIRTIYRKLAINSQREAMRLAEPTQP